MSKNSSRPVARHFSTSRGRRPLPEPDPARDGHADHRPSRPGFSKLPGAASTASKTIFKTTNPVIIYTAPAPAPGRPRSLNTPSPGDRGADGSRPGNLRCSGKIWRRSWVWCRVHQDRLAGRRRRSEGDRAKLPRGQEQGESRRSACCTTRPRPAASPIAEIPQGDRRRRPSGAVPGRHHLVARIDRLPARRMGRRTSPSAAPRRPDAAARQSFNAVSDKALAATREPRRRVRSSPGTNMLNMNKVSFFFPYTPATQMSGARVAIDMLHEEGSTTCSPPRTGWPSDAARGGRWGLEIICRDPKYYRHQLRP